MVLLKLDPSMGTDKDGDSLSVTTIRKAVLVIMVLSFALMSPTDRLYAKIKR